MITYIIKSQHYYKIGKTNHQARRLKEYDTHNPDFEVIHIIPINCEKQLHELFKDKHHKLEWFLLDDTDIEIIKQLEQDNELKDKSKKQRKPSKFEASPSLIKHREYINNLEEERIVKSLKGRTRCVAIKADNKQCTAPASTKDYCRTHAKMYSNNIQE